MTIDQLVREVGALYLEKRELELRVNSMTQELATIQDALKREEEAKADQELVEPEE